MTSQAGRRRWSPEVEVAMESPALRGQFVDYPAQWRGRVPFRVRMCKTVCSKIPTLSRPIAAREGGEYRAWVNSHGAVSAIIPNGDNPQQLGLKPYEFEVVEWHE